MFSTTYGPALATAPAPLMIPRDPERARAFAAAADCAAGLAEIEGRFDAAERLAHAAHEARCRAEVARR